MTIYYGEGPALRAKALREAKEAVGPCPNCGAEPNVDLIDVSYAEKHAWIPGQVSCSARCYEADPDGYLAALKRATGGG